ncbi:Endochitinase 33, partial [Ceratocystis fimbriata CBS 114723]
MFPSAPHLAVTVLAGLAALPAAVHAGYQSSTRDNIAVYWGQNSVGDADSQGRLAEYCESTPVNIIPIAFLNGIKNPTTVNFGSASDRCTKMPGTNLLSCPEIEEDITKCQTAGKTILLSIGGATYTEGGFSSAPEAEEYADKIWAMFGPETDDKDIKRPFGKAVIDGFDFDFEAEAANLVPFGKRLRKNMDASPGSYYLAAAPQCPYPDRANNEMLAGQVPFDFIMVQFYNNDCGVQSYAVGSKSQNRFNYETWDTWASTKSANKNVKVMLGIPATSSAGRGYVDADTLSEILNYCATFSSFGGVMMWDMSQLYNNDGYLVKVADSLSGTKAAPPTAAPSAPASTPAPTYGQTSFVTSTRTSTTTIQKTLPASKATASTSTVSRSDPSLYFQEESQSDGVSQWNQCGGSGYTGPVTCKAPYSCMCLNE